MAFIFYNKTWESKFDNVLSNRDNFQDMNTNKSKLEVHDTYKKKIKKNNNL